MEVPVDRSDAIIKATVSTPVAMTVAEYVGLQAAYDHFNAELFNGELPNVMIVLTRRAHSAGHFHADRFATRADGTKAHELSLNPDVFVDNSDKEILSTEVHEMVHVLQKVNGTASGAYHNQDFATRMKTRGLYPSNTGR